jgi:hypothetical protein
VSRPHKYRKIGIRVLLTEFGCRPNELHMCLPPLIRKVHEWWAAAFSGAKTALPRVRPSVTRASIPDANFGVCLFTIWLMPDPNSR